MRLLAVTTALLTLLLAGCSLDFAALSNFLDLHVVNNTRRTVTFIVPYQDVHDRVAPGHARDEAAWRNAQAGVALVRVASGGTTLGCLRVRYRKGQQHATVLVSDAKRCH